MLNIPKKLNILILTVTLMTGVLMWTGWQAMAANDGNSYGYAFSESAGWIRLDGTDSSQTYGVTVPSTDGGDLSGYAWGENAGWIHFAGSCSEVGGCPGGGNTYAVDSDQASCSAGWSCLSGYAWGEGVGWIKFAADASTYGNTGVSNYGVYIDSDGNFNGYAWSEQTGWIHFGGSCDEAGGCPSDSSNYGVGTSVSPPIAGDTLAGITITATGENIVIANNNITVTSFTGDGHKGILVSGAGVTADIFGNEITVSGDGTSHYGIEARSANVTLLRNTINAEDIDVVANVDGLIVTSGQNRLIGSGVNFSVKSDSGVIESANDHYSTISNSGTFRDLTGVRQYTCTSTESEGDVVYLSADNTVSQTDADAISSLGAIGFVVKKPSSTTCLVKSYGKVYSLTNDATANLTPGAVYYLSTTAGKITTDPGVSKYNQQIGVAKSAKILDISIKEVGATTILASGASDAFLVTQSGTGNIASFQDNGTNVFVIADGGNAAISNITAISGNSFSVTRNLASGSTDSSVISFVQDNAGDDQEVLTVRQDGTGNGLFIDQDGNGIALNIDSEATTAAGIGLNMDAVFTGTTTSSMLSVSNDNAGAVSGTVAYFAHDGASATGKVLDIKNDGTGNGLFIDQNGEAVALNIDSEATTAHGMTIAADVLTSGYGASISSTSTAFTGNLADLTLSGSNAANTGSVLALTNSGTLNTGASLYLKHYATGTNNLAFRVDDVSGDSSPFVIDGDGNVGIGLAAPLNTLEINGSLGMYNNIGSEKVTDGDFTGTAPGGWTVGANWTYDEANDEADRAVAAATVLEQDVSAVAGEIYKVVYEVKHWVAGSVTVSVGGVGGTARSADGTYLEYITATGTGNLQFTPSADANLSIDTVSVKKVAKYAADHVALWIDDRGDVAGKGSLFIKAEDGTTHVFGDNVGIGIASPSRKLETLDTGNPQLRLTQSDDTNYADFEVNSLGDLTISLYPIATGNDIILNNPDGSTGVNLWVCKGTNCQSVTLTTGGNLVVETDIYIGESVVFAPQSSAPGSPTEGTVYFDDNDKQLKLYDNNEWVDLVPDYHNQPTHCPDGYIPVPGDAKYGTTGGFCVMKYEAKSCVNGTVSTNCASGAKSDGGGDPEATEFAASYPENKPWVSIQQDADSAQEACENIGTGYHLMTNAEWMTIARNIERTTINDMDGADSLQLAVGNTDAKDFEEAANSVATIAGADPVVSSCDLTKNMEDAANDYTATCQIRGTGADGSLDADEKGFYDTGDVWATAYSAGGQNKSQLRTHVLSNGEVIWDLSGNVWEWTDDTIPQNKQPKLSGSGDDADGGGGWGQFTEIDDYARMSYSTIRPSDNTLNSGNGVGRIWTYGEGTEPTTERAFRCGGNWSAASYAGVFTLNLNGAPACAGTYIGFRCVR